MLREIDRCKGALVGLLCGDALGAPYETWTAERIAEDFAKRGGLVPFDYVEPWRQKLTFPAGRPTDDSDQAAALAASLIACKDVNEEDIHKRLKRTVFEGVSPLWDGRALGAGGTTRRMLAPDTWEEARGIPLEKDIPSNGSLMRAAPLAIFLLGRSLGFDETLVARASAVTHRHPLAQECVHTFALILFYLLTGPTSLSYVGEFILREVEELRVASDNLVSIAPWRKPRNPFDAPGTGDVVLTLQVAIHAFWTTRNFRDGLTAAIAVGGDTDTYAAVAGALLGAWYGLEGIPKEWRSAMKGADVMERLARDLYLHE